MINKPFNKKTDTLPYMHSSNSTRAIRRGNQRISVNDLGMVSVQRRVKSSKRKRDWI